MKKRIVAAMSGGVDSSVAASLLKQQGYEVVGITMKLFEEQEGAAGNPGCCGIRGVNDARKVSQTLGIPFYAIDCTAELKDKVIDTFAAEYGQGRTPNPCIACNSIMKFGLLLEKARTYDADLIATGHYAKTEYDDSRKRYVLKKGDDPAKEQSYFLYCLTQDQLEHTRFPVGVCTKEKVRQTARDLGLSVHDKPGSQEICFVPDDDYKAFLHQQDPNLLQPGAIKNRQGETIGEHQGIAGYTIGQRKGLGISHPTPLYVVSLEPDTNTVVVGEDEVLYHSGLVADSLNWISINQLSQPIKVEAKIRYRHEPAKARVDRTGEDKVRVTFVKPQRAITPGQAVVFYEGEMVVGGGVIREVIKDE